MKKTAFIAWLAPVSIAADWFALLAGWWWLTPVIGVFLGLALRPAHLGLLVSLCVGGLGWGLPLFILAINAPVKDIASAVESLIALSATGGVAIIGLTVVLGCILSIVGTWVGVTIKGLPGLNNYFNG